MSISHQYDHHCHCCHPPRLSSTYYVSDAMPGAHFALPLTPHTICGAGTAPSTLLRLRKTQDYVINLSAGVIAKGRKLWCPGAYTQTWRGVYCEMSGWIQATSQQSQVLCPSPPTDFKTQPSFALFWCPPTLGVQDVALLHE